MIAQADCMTSYRPSHMRDEISWSELGSQLTSKNLPPNSPCLGKVEAHHRIDNWRDTVWVIVMQLNMIILIVLASVFLPLQEDHVTITNRLLSQTWSLM